MSCGCGGQLPINQATLGDRLWRALNLRGSQQTPGQLPPSVDTSVKLLDLTEPQYAWLARSKRYFQAFAVSAVAAQNGSFEVRNLTASGILTIVERIEIMPYAGTGVGLFMSTVADLGLTTVVRNCAMDGRQEESGILSTPAMITQVVGGATVAAIRGNASFLTGAANVVLSIPGPFVLKSGTYLRCRLGTVNVGMDVRLVITERIPAPSEL